MFALVTGVQKLKPCGTAVAGMLLPREKPPLEFVPRVVITRSDGRAFAGAGPAGPRSMSSIQPPKSCVPRALS